MQLRYLYLTIILFFSSFAAFAQENEDEVRHRKWMEELMDYKKGFLSEEMELTEQQAEAFFPLYNEMEKEIFNVNKEIRDLVKATGGEKDVTEEKYQEVVKNILALDAKEAQIEESYYGKFAEILSYKQMFLLQRAESRFSRNLLNHHKGSNNRSH